MPGLFACQPAKCPTRWLEVHRGLGLYAGQSDSNSSGWIEGALPGVNAEGFQGSAPMQKKGRLHEPPKSQLHAQRLP